MLDTTHSTRALDFERRCGIIRASYAYERLAKISSYRRRTVTVPKRLGGHCTALALTAVLGGMLGVGFAVEAPSRNVGVLVDVSGSMAAYGDWYADAKQQVSHLLVSGAIDSDNWELTNSSRSKEFHLVGPADHILFMRFGSVIDHRYPYFMKPSLLPNVTDQGIQELLENNFPDSRRDFHERKTNRPLAEAVAAKYLVTHFGEHPVYLLIISDFLVDADVNSEEEQLIQAFENTYGVNTPLILAWKKNQLVQLKVLALVPAKPPAPVSSGEAAKLKEGPPGPPTSPPPSIGTIALVLTVLAGGILVTYRIAETIKRRKKGVNAHDD